MRSISVFCDITKVADSRCKNVDASRNQGYIFWILFRLGIAAKVHHCA